MVMYAKIRRMSIREKQSVSAIARKTSLSRNTIKKWLREPEGSETKYRRNRTEKIVTAFEPWVLQALKVDAHRPKRDRRTARMLFQAIRTQGFSGSYCRLTNRTGSSTALWSRNHVSSRGSKIAKAEKRSLKRRQLTSRSKRMRWEVRSLLHPSRHSQRTALA